MTDLLARLRATMPISEFSELQMLGFGKPARQVPINPDGEEAAARIEAMAGEIEGLRSLKRWLRHDGLCGIVGGYGYCTCGLEVARTALTAPSMKDD